MRCEEEYVLFTEFANIEQGKIKIILSNKLLFKIFISTLFQIEFIKIEKNALIGWRNSILKKKDKIYFK